MMPHYFQVEVLHNDRVNQFMAESSHVRLIREAQAERRRAESTKTDSPRNPGGLQALLAAMTRLWGVASS
ncbi:MAG TPA: hypothetical protein VFE42_15800 [Chloroflexota bacterium]|jgi:hypothetical protein|nr:hypothetical protein [Chloroflexota bacterium]